MRRPRVGAGQGLVVGAALLLVACSTTPPVRTPTTASPPEPHATPRSRPDPPRAVRPADAPGPETSALRGRLVRAAAAQLGRPYRYAGDTPRGFDCSGFVDFVYGGQGVRVPRTADAQSRAGAWVPMDEVKPGDLVFFGLDDARISHVGIVVSEPGAPLEMIHSATSRGIVRTEIERSKYWLARLRFARRLVD